MSNDQHKGAGKMNTEMCRQMKNSQMHRFVRSLPVFAVDTQLPDRFVELLLELDDVGSVHASRSRSTRQ